MSTLEQYLPTRHLDLLLDEICRALQLTQTQYSDAEQKYHAVADWLSRPGTLLAAGRPSIFPQGSVATQTTTKPWGLRWGQQEFDVDLVCQILLEIRDPMFLYSRVGERLREHAYYRTILEPMKRCWRLNYAGEIHLDILPARPDHSRPGSAILVPDRKLRDWSPSNPRDYAIWFNRQAERVPTIEGRKTEPLPDNDPAEDRPPLKRAVQLLKRRRDVYFQGDEDAPRSIVLTTLCGKHYGADDPVIHALLGILDRIAAEIEMTPGVLVVLNPTNSAENFAEAWQGNELAYRRFVRFISDFRRELRQLMGKTLAGGLTTDLNTLFGEEPTKRAMEGFAQRMEKARTERTLRFSPAIGLTIAGERTQLVPRNTFYGETEYPLQSSSHWASRAARQHAHHLEAVR